MPLHTVQWGLKGGKKNWRRLKAAKAPTLQHLGIKIHTFAKRILMHDKLGRKVESCVMKHDNVIHSPIANDTMLTKSTVAGVTQEMLVRNLVCEFLAWELYNSMVGPVEEGGAQQCKK
jgi:hypothetical protein